MREGRGSRGRAECDLVAPACDAEASRPERGSGTVLAVLVVAVTVFLALAAVAVVGAGGAQRRAASAADAAALAAADVAVGRVAGSGDPCATARLVAEANDAVLASCAVEDVVVTVTATVGYAGLSASASARAGPPGTP